MRISDWSSDVCSSDLAANRLASELPEGTPPGEVLMHWLKSAREADAARGVIWPMVDPAHVGKSGTAWPIFPNFQLGHDVKNALCYNFKQHSKEPNKCCFEVAVNTLFSTGQEPQTERESHPDCEP